MPIRLISISIWSVSNMEGEPSSKPTFTLCEIVVHTHTHMHTLFLFQLSHTFVHHASAKERLKVKNAQVKEKALFLFAIKFVTTE